MKTVAAKRAPREISKPKQHTFPADLNVDTCPICGVEVVWCRDGRPSGRTPRVAVQIAPIGARANVGMQRSLIVDEAPIAYETNLASRFALHEHHCAGSFSA